MPPAARRAAGHRIRLLTVIDPCTWEELEIEVVTSLPGDLVVRVLDRIASERGLPAQLVLDNGPELTGNPLDQWAYCHAVDVRFIDPGQPNPNAVCERFNGRFRDECLNEHWFLGLADARRIIEDWRHDYNHHRPHNARGYRMPAAVRHHLLAPLGVQAVGMLAVAGN